MGLHPLSGNMKKMNIFLDAKTHHVVTKTLLFLKNVQMGRQDNFNSKIKFIKVAQAGELKRLINHFKHKSSKYFNQHACDFVCEGKYYNHNIVACWFF
jgi:hypothetical protein